MRKHCLRIAVVTLVAGCGPAQEEQRSEGTTVEERRGPREMLACSTGNDPMPHVPRIQPWLPPGDPAQLVLETRPMVDEVTGDDLDDLLFYLRAGQDRFIALVGCQDSIVSGLGVFRMEGMDGIVELDKVNATGIPPGEILVKVTRREPPALYERWRYLRFDGASLSQIFAITKRNIPPTGFATRAEVSFIDRDGDGLNEVIAMEETLDGDGARTQNTDPTAPAPRLLGSRQVRFSFDRNQGVYVQAEALPGRGVISSADITAEPQIVSVVDAGPGPGGGADAGP